LRALAALGAVFASPQLRRLQLAWLGSIAGEFSFSVAISVYAYRQGGADAVGLVWLLRMVPAAVGAPFAALLGDRYRREWVMLAANLVRAAATAGTALLVWADAPAAPVYALGVVVALLSTIFWPAQAALLPALARTPGELTAANAASTTLEGIGSFVGPGLCGALLAATSIEAAFGATAVVFAVAALGLARVRGPEPGGASGEAGAVLRELFGGFRTVRSERPVRLLVATYGVWALVTGALNVLVVVTAIELLDLGEGGVGLLNAAIGIGGLVGAVAALAVARRRRLTGTLVLGMLVWSAPVALLAARPDALVAVALLGVAGAGYILMDISTLTLVQRVVPDEVRARVLGIIEGLWVGTIGLGAALTPAVIDLAGVRGALLGCGLVLPAFAVVALHGLRRIDAGDVPERELDVLRRVPFLEVLPEHALEALASAAIERTAEPGEAIVREREAGDRFYVVVRGMLEVTARGVRLSMLGPGSYFGEIALLRDVPRTATVRAVEPAELLALDRNDFLGAVSGYEPSATEADSVVRSRLRASLRLRRTL
jgi:MFS family permease